MREIKFRAFNINEPKMCRVVSSNFIDEVIVRFPEFEGHQFSDDYNDVMELCEFEPLMQYTGLKDVNGREIYEGDIVRTWEETEHIPNRDSGGGIIDYDQRDGYSQLGVVEFRGAWFTYETKKHLKGREENIYAPLDFTNRLEVVGNVYEHGHLLEGME